MQRLVEVFQTERRDHQTVGPWSTPFDGYSMICNTSPIGWRRYL